MKKIAAIMFGLLFLVGCGQSSEKDESEEVSGNVETKEVQFTVDVKESQENVQFEMTLRNNTEEEKNFEFRSGQKYDIIVLDKNGAEVYKYSKGRMFTQAIQYVNLLPGKSQTWQETWDLKSNGKKVDPGEYDVTVVLTGKAEGVKTLQAKEKLTVSE
ncbi:proteinase inhibitor [Bacillus sp. PAMC26568]|nr:proteinase inhibitor [Bacillus sp. PAMC26568]